ncbi:MAG: kynureninase [Acidimicrobiaceae bacterium]
MTAASRGDAEALDARDPLGAFVERFARPDADLVYLDGNSLGRLPHATRTRLRDAVDHEWGDDLVRGWSRWLELPRAVGDRLGTELLGAGEGEVLVCDSTTVNLYKLAVAALDARPDRPDLVVPEREFPTDRYVLEGIAERAGGGRSVRFGSGADADERTALVVASVVDYRTSALTDIAATTAHVHDAGALMLWDLSHAVGSVPVDLTGSGADLAVGCTYKHLCAGPGAPAFLYVRGELQEQLRQPIWGWFGQDEQFAMGPHYTPADGIDRFLTGTPNVLGLLSVDEGVALVAEAGIQAIAEKGRALTSLLIDLAEEWLSPLAFVVASPTDARARGAHVSLAHPEALAISQALIAEAAVVADFRPPDLLRLGPAPLSSRFVDVWDGLERLRHLVSRGGHSGYADVQVRVT